MKDIINKLYEQRQNYIIIGLTGKTGSGCSTAADILAKNKEDINIPNICIDDSSNDHVRKKSIILTYFKENWAPFTKISVSDVITTFVLENSHIEIKNYLNSELIGGSTIELDTSEFEYYSKENNIFTKTLRKFSSHKDFLFSDAENVHNYLYKILPSFTKKLKKYLLSLSFKNNLKAYQIFGDNIRKSGCAINESFSADNIYSIAERINTIIKILRVFKDQHNEKHYFCVDAFRNPFETLFFKERYSAFYLMAIKTNEDFRYDRLSKGQNLNFQQIESLDKKENPDESPLNNYDGFVSQNISACIGKADIHINNEGKFGTKAFKELTGRLITYISLIQHPGLITPSRDEKLMQIAHTVKLNSGCISRQVGAVVTNSHGAIVSLGWNDVPEGQTQCLLRSLFNLKTGTDTNSYSEYEQTNERYKQQVVAKLSTLEHVDDLKGRNLSFCFKNLHNEIKGDGNPVHTRALHAEENAFLQIVKHGGQSVKGGTLYTTASPCELCSKKAYQLGIARIIYIEPYPGIAIQHVVRSGTKQPEMVLFSGAIGLAYSKLYDPLFPFKDELNAFYAHPSQ